MAGAGRSGSSPTSGCDPAVSVARPELEQTRVGLGATELLLDLGSLDGTSSGTLSAGLLGVVPLAQRTEVAVAVIVSGADVVHLGCALLAPPSLVWVDPGAAVAVALQDVTTDGVPVLGESSSTVRSGPAWQRGLLGYGPRRRTPLRGGGALRAVDPGLSLVLYQVQAVSPSRKSQGDRLRGALRAPACYLLPSYLLTQTCY